MAVIEVKHPLVKHKIGLMREADISTKKFRELTGEIARLQGRARTGAGGRAGRRQGAAGSPPGRALLDSCH